MPAPFCLYNLQRPQNASMNEVEKLQSASRPDMYTRWLRKRGLLRQPADGLVLHTPSMIDTLPHILSLIKLVNKIFVTENICTDLYVPSISMLFSNIAISDHFPSFVHFLRRCFKADVLLGDSISNSTFM